MWSVLKEESVCVRKELEVPRKELFVENGVSDKPVRVRREAGGSVELSLVRRRRDGAGSFVVVGENLEVPRKELFPELSAAGPCARGGSCRRTEGEPADDAREVPFFFFSWFIWGVCVCV